MSVLVIFLPLLSALGVGFLGPWLGDRWSQLISCGVMLVAMIFSWILFKDVALNGNPFTEHLASWFAVGPLAVDWALRFDALSTTMICVVMTVSTMVHIYSVGYMAHDPSIPRFMSYLSLFTFLMLMLVTADNLLQLFFGWEGVGLASYLLIGFWYEKPSANAAASKAFIVNRVGDVGLILGIIGVFLTFHTLQLDQIFGQIPQVIDLTYTIGGYEVAMLPLICALLFLGAMGKSAQLGLHVWLPDAMEGPTPVSALIHAATMVTAGVFLIARLSPLFEQAPGVLEAVTVIGATTAIFAATIALAQNDIKRVIAYSTCSQLGYMFFAAGVSAYGASLFHLVTHAFFKALLFLGAGAVIHAMSDEQDLRHMGGLGKLIPATYGLMWVGNLALAGIPGLSGYYSKDMILEHAWAAGTSVGFYAFFMGLAAAFLTALYSWRLLFMAFHGAPRCDEKVLAHVHEAPYVMLVPLAILAMGAVVVGVLFQPYILDPQFWGQNLFVLPEHQGAAEHALPRWVQLSPTVCALAGISVAGIFYLWRPQWSQWVLDQWPALNRLLANKWYVDEAYEKIFQKPAQSLGRFLATYVDQRAIDAWGPGGVSRAVAGVSRIITRLHGNYIYYDLLVMILGIVVIILLCLWRSIL